MSNPPIAASQFFEDCLREHIRYNSEHGVLPSESEVARRLLNRGPELAEVYEEIQVKLRMPTAKKVLISCLLSAGAFWSPEQIAKDRAGRDELVALNLAIAKRAHELADMLVRRSELHDKSGFSSNTHYDVIAVIDEASAGNGRYDYYLKEPLAHLRARFDMKYWPLLDSIVRVIADDADRAEVRASDPLTESATRSKRPSTADFTRALEAAIQENRGTYSGGIPREFMLSDQSMASLVNVLLDLPVERMVDPIHVKNSRSKGKKLTST